MDETQFLNMNHQSQTSNKKKSYQLLKYEELPEYMKDNEYILNHYRADWPLSHALVSLFFCHNETLNIWTHLIGFVGFLVLTIANLTQWRQVADFFHISIWAFGSNHASQYSEMDVAEWPMFVYLGGSILCLLSSSLCHLFSCHSPHLNRLLSQLDYTGIAIMIITSFFPPIYYIFQCNPLWLYIYLGGITVIGVFTIVTLLSRTKVTGKYRSFRTLLFVVMGLFGVIPAIHAAILNWDVAQRNVTLGFESLMALSYLAGAVFYVTRVPEKWKPGMFDLVGHSHQIFHVFVVMGALAHYAALLVFYEYRRRVGCD